MSTSTHTVSQVLCVSAWRPVATAASAGSAGPDANAVVIFMVIPLGHEEGPREGGPLSEVVQLLVTQVELIADQANSLQRSHRRSFRVDDAREHGHWFAGPGNGVRSLRRRQPS